MLNKNLAAAFIGALPIAIATPTNNTPVAILAAVFTTLVNFFSFLGSSLTSSFLGSSLSVS